MTRDEAIEWLKLDIEMMKFDPTTGREAYLNNDARKTLEALKLAIAALRGCVYWDSESDVCALRRPVIEPKKGEN